MIDIREVEVKYRAILDSCFLHHDKISLFCMQKVSQKLGDMAGRAKAGKEFNYRSRQQSHAREAHSRYFQSMFQGPFRNILNNVFSTE